jgi:hypothetical protein
MKQKKLIILLQSYELLWLQIPIDQISGHYNIRYPAGYPANQIRYHPDAGCRKGRIILLDIRYRYIPNKSYHCYVVPITKSLFIFCEFIHLLTGFHNPNSYLLYPSVLKLQSFLSLGCQQMSSTTATPRHGLSEGEEEAESDDEEITNMVRNFSIPGRTNDQGSVADPGWFIPDPGSDHCSIPDLGSGGYRKKAPDPGSYCT